MEKDVFCKIVDGEIPCYKVYEDADVLAFLDISQVTRGHTLVIPKKHYDNFLAVPQETMHKVMDIAQRIGQVAIKFLNAKGVNILTNCYEAAGQTVKHFHVHVIPRYEASRYSNPNSSYNDFEYSPKTEFIAISVIPSNLIRFPLSMHKNIIVSISIMNVLKLKDTKTVTLAL